MILHSGELRFSRLDKLDDPLEKYINEQKSGKPMASIYFNSPREIGKFCYVSSFVDTDEESIAMWSMYADDRRGVRIGIEADDIFDLDRIAESRRKSRPTKPLFKTENESIVIPEFINIEYQAVEDMPRFYSQLIPHWDEMGKHKTKDWEFQRECRFRIFAFYNSKEKNVLFYLPENSDRLILNDYIEDNERVIPEYLSFPVKKEIFNRMRITVGPDMEKADSILLKALLNDQGISLKNVDESKFRDIDCGKGLWPLNKNISKQ